MAVAYRPQLGEAATAALAEYGVEEALKIACANDNAAFTEAALSRVVARFPSSEGVHIALAYRRTLPKSVAERLARMASDALHDHLVRNHGLGEATASQLSDEAMEQVTLDRDDAGPRKNPPLRRALNVSGRMTPSLMLRAWRRDHEVLRDAIASSRVPHHALVMSRRRALGRRAIYERAPAGANVPAFARRRQLQVGGVRRRAHDKEKSRARDQRSDAQHGARARTGYCGRSRPGHRTGVSARRRPRGQD